MSEWHEDDCMLSKEYRDGNYLLDVDHIRYLETANLLSNYIVKGYIQKINLAIYQAILNFEKTAEVKLSVNTKSMEELRIYEYFMYYMKKQQLSINSEKLDYYNNTATIIIGWK